MWGNKSTLRMDDVVLVNSVTTSFGMEAVALDPTQIHAQQHLYPVLGLSVAGSRLDVEAGLAVAERLATQGIRLHPPSSISPNP